MANRRLLTLIGDERSVGPKPTTLGHSQIAITSDLYAHTYDAARQRIADRMDMLLNPVATLVAPSAALSKPN